MDIYRDKVSAAAWMALKQKQTNARLWTRRLDSLPVSHRCGHTQNRQVDQVDNHLCSHVNRLPGNRPPNLASSLLISRFRPLPLPLVRSLMQDHP